MATWLERLLVYIAYTDITSRIAEPPTWWLEGVPRYGPFDPKELNVYNKQSLLVHTVCQICDARFDVGLYAPSSRYPDDFRDVIEAYASVQAGDPPSACCGGGHTSSMEIEVLEFWERTGLEWTRDETMELPLADADWFNSSIVAPQSITHRILLAGLEDDWTAAYRANDRARKKQLLEIVACSRPDDVLDLFERKQRRDEVRMQLHRP